MTPQRFGDGRDWFLENRFGLFVHWGPYAVPGWHEQIQQRRGLSRAEYSRLIAPFNPVDFDPAPWLDAAQEAGMSYLVLTAKHHDGFCMWDTATTDYKVTRQGAPDVVGKVASACHARGIKLGLYYSIVDWHHPAYPNEGRHHELPPQRDDHPDATAYLAYLKEQIRELCTRYGEISYLWWDMNVPGWEDESIHAMIRQLQPACVINDRGFHNRATLDPWRDGIIITRERDYQAALGESGQAPLPVPTESCESLDQLSWGYKTDPNYHSLHHLKRNLADNLARGANYLLNVGPDTEGRFPSEQCNLLRQLGDWYARVRECFDGTQLIAGLVAQPHILVMQRDCTYYLIVTRPLNFRDLPLRPINARPHSVRLLNTGTDVSWTCDIVPQDVTRPFLRLRELPVDALAGDVMVIKLTFDKPLKVKSPSAKVAKI